MGEYALVTGASGDIGLAISRQLAADHLSVYLHYNRNTDAVIKLQNELTNLYPRQHFHIVQADLSQSDGVDVLVDQIKDDITLVVNNCGQSHVGLISDVKDQTAESFIQLHVTSPFLLTKRLLPQMISRKQGRLIFVTSVWGVSGAAMEVMYSMVKGGQNSMVKALAKEVAPSGISVNAIAPGAVDTKMLSSYDKEDMTHIIDEIPMGRLAQPKEIADLVSFLASSKANYINGQIIQINGAWQT